MFENVFNLVGMKIGKQGNCNGPHEGDGIVACSPVRQACAQYGNLVAGHYPELLKKSHYRPDAAI